MSAPEPTRSRRRRRRGRARAAARRGGGRRGAAEGRAGPGGARGRRGRGREGDGAAAQARSRSLSRAGRRAAAGREPPPSRRAEPRVRSPSTPVAETAGAAPAAGPLDADAGRRDRHGLHVRGGDARPRRAGQRRSGRRRRRSASRSRMMNRHGLVAGATGTGKTRTLQGLAEQLAAKGVPGVRRRHQGRPLGRRDAGRAEREAAGAHPGDRAGLAARGIRHRVLRARRHRQGRARCARRCRASGRCC